jgi:excisionase family DNA binding protein
VLPEGASTQTMPLLLKVEETADILRLSRTAVYALISRGEIDTVKIGQRRRVVASSLHCFVAARVAALEAGGKVQGPTRIRQRLGCQLDATGQP